MPKSAMESVRQRLDDIRRQRNVILALAFLGRWLLLVSLVFILLVVAGTLFSFGASGWKISFLLWVTSVFGLSFYFFWNYRRRWESSRHFVHRVERELPELEQRLITSMEFDQRGDVSGVSRQLVDGLLADASQRVQAQPLSSFISFTAARWALAGAAGMLFIVTALFQFSDNFARGTQKLTWAWKPSTAAEVGPAVVIHVEPGHVALQRGDDLRIVANLEEANANQLTLYVQDDRLNWRQISMQPDEGESAGTASVFAVDLHQLNENFVYYVEYPGSEQHERVRTTQYQVTLFDLPRVEGMALTYNYPSYTGLDTKEEDPGGDILAPEGTEIHLNAELNKSVHEAHVVFDDGTRLPMSVQDNKANAVFQVSEDGVYHIELVDHRSRQNKNPDEHYVRVIKDRAPTISLRAPGRDQRVMPLEEVAFEVKADDDYGLTEFELIYSIIGGEEHRVDLLGGNAPLNPPRTINGETLLYLEDLQVQPGDVISYSVAVRDNNALKGPAQVVSDIYFLEVTPTDHEFSRARGGGDGGGGGGGSQSSALVNNQKDVIAATWKLRNGREQMEEERFVADSRIIRDSQAEVAQRAQMSISRLTERGNFAQDNYENAVRALQRAISEMESALDNLDQLAMTDALAAEQRALHAIMQAESLINKTEIAVSRAGGGGGGNQNGEREELRELFEMELGQLENRYQLPQQQAGHQDAQQNETLDKLKELARRQERLTRSQRELAQREEQLEEEQRRRQLEQLRREQEELRRELAELNQSMGQQSSQSGASGQSGNAMQQALQEMQEAAASESPSQAAAKGQKALDALRRQADSEEANSQRSLAQLQEAVKRRGEELLQQQRQLQRNVEQESRSQSLSNSRGENAAAGASESLMEQQGELRRGVEQLARDLRQIASGAGEDRERAARDAHELARALRPIQDKMETSQQILKRGMLNLSLKLESDIEAELAQVQQGIQNLGGEGQRGSPGGDQVADQLRELRDSLETLQRQLAQNLPNELAQRRGESSQSAAGDGSGDGAPSASRADMQQNLQRSRDLARGLVQLGAGGQPWSGSARSIRTQLTQKSLEEFLNEPELLAGMVKPLVELERQLRMESELSQLEKKMFSASDQQVPEQYKSMVENYYRLLSERRSAREQ